MGNVKIPLFKKADLDASIGVLFDGFSKVILSEPLAWMAALYLAR